MTSPTEPRTGQQLYHDAPLALGKAIALVAFAVGTLYLAQIVLVAAGAPELVASIGGDVLAIASIVLVARRRKLRMADLGVRAAAFRHLVAAVLLGISTWYLTALLVELLRPPGDTSRLQKLVEQTPLVPTLLALTVFPAIAEELIFRGVLVRSLAGRLRAPVAIGLSAATFGLYHLFPPQIVSTFALGLVLGLLTLRSRSIVPAVIVHLLNNTIAVVLSRDEIPALGDWMVDNSGLVLVGALVCVASGIVLAMRGAHER